MIKKSIITFLFFSASFLMADMGAVYFSQSNQYFTTAGFENNEYDYMLDPFLLNKLDRPWLFMALDGNGWQFGDNFSAGWVTGMENNLNFILSYDSTTNYSSTEDSTSPNDESSYTDYSDEVIADNSVYTDFRFHTGLTLNQGYGLIAQFKVLQDYNSYENSFYSDNYDMTGDLVSKNSLTQVKYNVINNENIYALDLATGINMNDKEITLNASLSFINPIDRYASTVTTFYDTTIIDEPNTDSQKVDYIVTSEITGQISNDYSTLLSYDTNTTDKTLLTRSELDISSIIVWSKENGLKFNLPIIFGLNVYGDLESMETISTKGYKDDTNTLITENTTVTIETLSIPSSLDITTGLGLEKSFKPSVNTNVYLGADGYLSFSFFKEVKGQEVTTTTKIDTDQSGIFDEGETSNVSNTLENGITISESTTAFEIKTRVAATFSPVDLITFHATAFPYVRVNYTSTETVNNTGDVYTYTDNILSANSTSTDTKGLTITDTYTNSTFAAGNWGRFGFILNFSDNFKLDTKASVSRLAFDEFSVMALFSY